MGIDLEKQIIHPVPIQAPTPDGLTHERMDALGVADSDLPEVNRLVDTLRQPGSIATFGEEISKRVSEYTDNILSQVRGHDLGGAGSQLTKVLQVARNINTKTITGRGSKPGILSAILRRVKLGKAVVGDRFSAASEQIGQMMTEIETTRTDLITRSSELEQMSGSVKDEYRLLGVYIAAAEVRIAELRKEADKLGDKASPLEVHEQSERNSRISNLEIRSANFMALQQSALQTLPQIAVLRSSNHALVEKFDTIKTVTIPAWKRQFALAIGLAEQRNAVNIADQVDNLTNDLLKKDADLLHKNAVGTAKANQRLVIDTDTLRHVHSEMIATVRDVIAAQQDGAKKRAEAVLAIDNMRKDLRKSLAAPQSTQTAPRLTSESPSAARQAAAG